MTLTAPSPPRLQQAAAGLTEAEAAAKLAAAPLPSADQSSRSYASIVRANVVTIFNAILLAFGLLTLMFGEWQDALFLGVVVANSTIGIVQEIRAKRALDALTALVAPTATVVRDGAARRVAVGGVVEGDLVRLEAGDQVVGDGTLVETLELAVDEAIVTGESEPARKRTGDAVRSGSFAVEGTGSYLVAAIGAGSYAARITGEARTFRHPRSPLERAMTRLLLILVGILIPLGTLLVLALWERRTPLEEAVPTAVAAVVTLVPEGLVLLASLTYAVAAIRMARRGALAQQLNAVESLAAVDLVCLDKTGTLTEAALRVVELVPADGVERSTLEAAAGRFAAASPTANATIAAMQAFAPSRPERPVAGVPFSSARRWSALRFAAETDVLGAPEGLELGALGVVAGRLSAGGRRVLALVRTDEPLDASGQLPVGARPLGLIVLAEQLRPNVRETISFFRAQGIELKVLSGDRPETVAAIARDAGLPVRAAIDGSHLPQDRRELTKLVAGADVIGRIAPKDKRRVVEALRDSGHYVAMIGDGVNDVPALKAARLAIAQGSGTQMARAVADLILVRGDFNVVPALIEEGRRILRNLQRVTSLYVTKSAFAVFLILSIGLTATAYPLLPRHLTLAASLTIGIPSFFLALGPSSGAYRQAGFLRDVARFTIPAGTAAGLAVVSTYLFTLNVVDLSVLEARTVATTTLIAVGLYLLVALEASSRARSVVMSGMSLVLGGAYALVLLTPGAREFFALAPPGWELLASLTGATVAAAGLWLVDDRFAPVPRPRHTPTAPDRHANA
ncbi:MAG TPA: HAD-IC family P-type ATPase [Gaiellaceae bacterium]|nr:HAD-IC family P-type ATPase [Gaiellaceae bacterium]